MFVHMLHAETVFRRHFLRWYGARYSILLLLGLLFYFFAVAVFTAHSSTPSTPSTPFFPIMCPPQSKEFRKSHFCYLCFNSTLPPSCIRYDNRRIHEHPPTSSVSQPLPVLSYTAIIARYILYRDFVYKKTDRRIYSLISSTLCHTRWCDHIKEHWWWVRGVSWSTLVKLAKQLMLKRTSAACMVSPGANPYLSRFKSSARTVCLLQVF